MHRSARVALFGIGAAIFVASLDAPLASSRDRQQPPQQPVFRTGVDLVQVDVVVVDKDGTVIRGLKQRDFTVLDRKKPQSIAVFDEVSYERPSNSVATMFPPTLRMDVASNRTVRADRLVLIVVDDLHIYKERTERAKDLLRQVINELGPQASMALIFTSGEHSTQVTQDRSQLLGAAEYLKGRQPWRRPNAAIDSQHPGAGDPEQDPIARLDVMAAAGKVSLQEFEDNLTTYKTVQDAARMLGADDARRKAFVLLSEGIAKDLTGMFDSETTPCEAQAADPGSRSAPTPPHGCYHDVALRQMMESMRRSNVTAYAIDPRGKVSPQDLLRESTGAAGGGLVGSASGTPSDEDSQFAWYNPLRQAQHGLELTAAASGGFAVTNTDDFPSGIQHIIEDLDHYYLLGFYPSDRAGKNFRPLDVKVIGHPEWTLRFRKGYMPGGPPAPPKNPDPLVALAAGVMPKSDLALQLFAAAFPAQPAVESRGATRPRVAVALEITAPTQSLKETDGKLRDEVSYEVLVVDEKKVKVTSRGAHAARLALNPQSPGGATPESVSYQIPLSLDLAPGHYQLRASASSAKLTKGGSVYLEIEVPDFTKEPITLSGLVLGYADGAHVPVARLTAPPTRLAAPGASRGRPVSPADPMVALPFEPSLSREFTTTDTLRVYVEVARKSRSTPLQATVALVDEGDRIVTSSDHPIPANDRGQIDLRLPLATLTPGAYRLRINVTDGKHPVEQQVGIVVR